MIYDDLPIKDHDFPVRFPTSQGIFDSTGPWQGTPPNSPPTAGLVLTVRLNWGSGSTGSLEKQHKQLGFMMMRKGFKLVEKQKYQ